ncbi:helix-turn-helix domain-containing protein [Streptomyces goshikiensis]|uniref:helix-turn-helix domain-containing protein n=1 Tax=Streptomyces goshikiensis TaxID=1942 RepID=UPI0033249B29
MAAACSDSSALPRLFRPEEIADALGCSAWWVKDRASRGRIPFTRVGRSYRFTAEHLAEIIRLHEVRLAIAPEPATPSVRMVPPRTAAPSARLRARRPRRARQDDFDTTA